MDCTVSADEEFETHIGAARILYEGTHGMTIAQLSEITQIAPRTLKIYCRDQNWKKDLETKHGGSTEAAQQAAAMFQGEQFEREQNGVTEAEAVNELTAPLPTEREALLERHKAEWSVPRTMASEAVRLRATNPMGAFERAKMAKITGETLKIIQDGERRAHGIDKAPDGIDPLILERT
jgi:hypothetical protein